VAENKISAAHKQETKDTHMDLEDAGTGFEKLTVGSTVPFASSVDGIGDSSKRAYTLKGQIL
jgi:hypothetical protein